MAYGFVTLQKWTRDGTLTEVASQCPSHLLLLLKDRGIVSKATSTQTVYVCPMGLYKWDNIWMWLQLCECQPLAVELALP